MMKNIVVVVAVVCGTCVSVVAQWRTVEIPDTLSRSTNVKGMVLAPDGSVIVLSDHEYDWSTLGGFRHTRWFARIHRVYQDGTVRHLRTFSNGNNENEPGTRFSAMTILNDTIVFLLVDQHDAQVPMWIGILGIASDSIHHSEVFSKVYYICDVRRAMVSLSSTERRAVDVVTGEMSEAPPLQEETIGLGPIVLRNITNERVLVERMCTSERVVLTISPIWNRPTISVGLTGIVYRFERDAVPSQPIVGISWSNDLGSSFSKVSRPGTIIAYGSLADGDHAFVTQHSSGSKYRVSFSDRSGDQRFGYYEAPDTLRIGAVAGRNRRNVALGVNWYDSTHKARVGVAFLDPSLSVTDEYQESRPASWKAYTTLGQYVTGGEGAFDVAVLDRGMYIVVEGSKAHLVMKQ